MSVEGYHKERNMCLKKNAPLNTRPRDIIQNDRRGGQRQGSSAYLLCGLLGSYILDAFINTPNDKLLSRVWRKTCEDDMKKTISFNSVLSRVIVGLLVYSNKKIASLTTGPWDRMPHNPLKCNLS